MEKQPKTESPDPKMTPEEWQIPMKRVKPTCIKIRAGNRKFVWDNKFEPIAEQSRDKRTKQGRSIARFECDGGAPTSCGGCGEERSDAQVGNEGWSGDMEGRGKDPNLAGMFLRNSVVNEPLCEMASEWTPMPQPLVFDSGAAETIIPSMWFPSHKTAESEGSKRGVFHTTAAGSYVEKEEEQTLIMSTADGGQLRKFTFQVASVNKARGSVSMMVRNGNRVVFHTSG